jgi:hypothetical protein
MDHLELSAAAVNDKYVAVGGSAEMERDQFWLAKTSRPD